VVRSVLERERNSRGCCVHMTYMHMVVVERKGEEEGKREREREVYASIVEESSTVGSPKL